MSASAWSRRWRKAGFPACVSAVEIAKLANPVRLPECEAERAKAATAKAG